MFAVRPLIALLCLGVSCAPATRPAKRQPEPPAATVTTAAAPAAPAPQPAVKPTSASPAPRAVAVARRVEEPALAAEFNNLFVDGDVYFSGWPSEAGLRAMSARGVKTVIALKTPEQVLEARNYDPRKLAKQLGIDLVVIPVSSDTYDLATVERFAKAFDAAKGPVLIHCGSSSTVGGVWSGYLYAKRGVPAEQALERGAAAGLREGPMSDAAERVIGSAKPGGAQ
jgi:uncharacterized protein (TIGR01244 family)